VEWGIIHVEYISTNKHPLDLLMKAFGFLNSRHEEPNFK
jgi:hypothetical protein